MKFLIAIFLSTALFASLHDKSAMVYYGKDISYPTVGIHDYIIVQPSYINTFTNGFKIYKDKMYAYVSIGEIVKSTPEYKDIKKEWILTKNNIWKSEVLDLKNQEYINFIFDKMIEPQIKRGFQNFFFDTLDSYQLASKTKEDLLRNKRALVSFIEEFHKRYPNAKLIVNRGFEVIDQIHDLVNAVLFESYYRGIGGKKLAYKKVSDTDRKWLDIYIKKIQDYGLDVICVDYLQAKFRKKAKSLIKKLKAKNMIPYIGNRKLDIYGLSSKNALKREVFTLINEKTFDRTLLESHKYGGLILEYMGYIQKLYDIQKGLPNIQHMRQYAGVIIWLEENYNNPKKLIKWVKSLEKIGVKVVFIDSFGFNNGYENLKKLKLKVDKVVKRKKKIIFKDKVIGYEIEPSLSMSTLQVSSRKFKPLLIYEHTDGSITTSAAYTSWGGYAIDNSFRVHINKNDILVINPFKFLKKALGLKKLIVPDVTTENGKRLFFTHADGDGIMNRVEGDFGYYSGDVILNDILKVYNVPHSISLVGSEVSENGLYRDIYKDLLVIAKDIYSLENVEPATHTYSHPIYWNKIKNDNLDEQYRLAPKDYIFSLEKELSETLKFINTKLKPKREAKEVFWSGDCAPQKNALEYVYKHNILNINGGDTMITKTKPWLSAISPLAVERDSYIQVYTGAQNENMYTNNWSGPYWGFKRVTQTFELTNSPKRFKPIDIYYHLYSGSKQASIKALKYVFDWVLKQDIMPIFTSEYIPKVMEYYTVSMANSKNEWLINGLSNLKTIRIEKKDASIKFNKSPSVIGLKHFEKHTYLNLAERKKHFIVVDSNKSYESENYLVSANAKVIYYEKKDMRQKISFKGHVDLKLDFHLQKGCTLISVPKFTGIEENSTTRLNYEGIKEAIVELNCI